MTNFRSDVWWTDVNVFYHAYTTHLKYYFLVVLGNITEMGSNFEDDTITISSDDDDDDDDIHVV